MLHRLLRRIAYALRDRLAAKQRATERHRRVEGLLSLAARYTAEATDLFEKRGGTSADQGCRYCRAFALLERAEACRLQAQGEPLEAARRDREAAEWDARANTYIVETANA